MEFPTRTPSPSLVWLSVKAQLDCDVRGQPCSIHLHNDTLSFRKVFLPLVRCEDPRFQKGQTVDTELLTELHKTVLDRIVGQKLPHDVAELAEDAAIATIVRDYRLIKAGLQDEKVMRLNRLIQ